MSFMLVGVLLFFILVGLFALSILSLNLKKSADEISETRTLNSLVDLASSPEFSCVESRINCIDADKLMGLMKIPLYKNFWDFSSLQILKESGFEKSEKEMINCNEGNYVAGYENCDRFIIFDKKIENEQKIGSYVAICRIEYENFYPYEKCGVGKLVVGREMKEVSNLFTVQYLTQMFGGVYDYGEKTPENKLNSLWLLGLIILLLIVLIIYLFNKKSRKRRRK